MREPLHSDTVPLTSERMYCRSDTQSAPPALLCALDGYSDHYGLPRLFYRPLRSVSDLRLASVSAAPKPRGRRLNLGRGRLDLGHGESHTRALPSRQRGRTNPVKDLCLLLLCFQRWMVPAMPESRHGAKRKAAQVRVSRIRDTQQRDGGGKIPVSSSARQNVVIPRGTALTCASRAVQRIAARTPQTPRTHKV